MQQAKSNGQADPEQVKGLLNFARDSLSKMELLEDVHCRILSDVSSHLENATQVGTSGLIDSNVDAALN